MKKFTALVLALVLVMSMTITSSAIDVVNVDYDLKGASSIAVDENGTPCDIYFAYLTGNIVKFSEIVENYNSLLNSVLTDPTNYPEMTTPTLMGLYLTHMELDGFVSKDVTYKITPQIAGFDENTVYQLFTWDRMTGWTGVRSSVNGSSIEVSISSKGNDQLALLVDKSTLSEGVEPVQQGNNIFIKEINGHDGDSNPVSALGLIYNIDFNIADITGMFTSLFVDDLYFNMISQRDPDANKDDLVMLEGMDILYVTKEAPVYPLTFNFEYDKVNENSVIYILHGNRSDSSDGYDWELIIPNVEDGALSVEFNSLSPVVIYADKTTLNGYVAPTPLSPVTGDSDMGYALIIGLIALVSMGLVAKKND